jgi:plastocyanin
MATPCWGDAVIQGVIWSTPAEARRAARARVEIAAEQVKPRPSLYPASTRTEPAPPPKGKLTPMPVLRVQPGMRDAVVYVQSIPDKVEKKLADRERKSRERPNYRIVQADSRFTPRVTAVAAGSNVEVQNLDDIWHNTFSVSRAKTFDLGKIRPGKIDTVLFDEAGVVNLHCDIHPKETGFVMVAPNHALTRPDSLGRFDLPKLPAGHYQLRYWHPTLGEGSLEIDLPKKGNLDVDVAFP